MLFNSYIFIFVFLPITFFVYRALCIRERNAASINWLIAASIFFYGWWNPKYVPLIVLSMVINYLLGGAIQRRINASRGAKKSLLIVGICFNLGLLGYFKYANFFIDSLAIITGANLYLETIVLPLAISFFTFQQIAYLVDVSRGDMGKYDFRHYALFVTFFPQLIAGPIVHHREMLPQFMREDRHYLDRDVAVGLIIFSIGLFKKAVFADGIAAYGSPVFAQASAGEPISFFIAWGGALCYTFQLYFDFSGYSDMAIGAARMFGIRLPVNFNSPYKSTSISDFWRRWHMTLSRFLRDYVYISLGGNRDGQFARYRNLMATMLLGGLWHGAGWTFVIWGGLHGMYLGINHAWRAGLVRLNLESITTRRSYQTFAWTMTFLAVVVGWVLFRAESTDAASHILAGMIGLNGIAVPAGILARLGQFGAILQSAGVEPMSGGGKNLIFMYAWISFLSFVAIAAPNTQQIMIDTQPHFGSEAIDDDPPVAGVMRKHMRFKFDRTWAALSAVCAVGGIFALTSISEFLYFQF